MLGVSPPLRLRSLPIRQPFSSSQVAAPRRPWVINWDRSKGNACARALDQSRGSLDGFQESLTSDLLLDLA